jgi:hemoglobin
MKQDITTEEDIRLLVHTFYDRVRADDSLGPIFNEAIKEEEWSNHLATLTDFWSTILLYTGKYKDDPMTKHKVLPINKAHFGRWTELFQQTVEDLFSGETAETAKQRAANIARIMQNVIGITKKEL